MQAEETAPSDPPAAGFTDSSEATDIPAFGIEAEPSERPRVSRILSAYLAALEREEWRAACSYMAAATAAQMRQVVMRVKQVKDKSCREGVRLLVATAARERNLYYGPVDVVALRIKRGNGAGEGAGFALFHGDDGADYWGTVRLEGGEWKVTSLVVQPLR